MFASILHSVRLEDRQREALEKRALAMGKTMSEVVRDILECALALAEETISSRAGHLEGRLALLKPERGSLRERLKTNHWRRPG